MIELIASNLKMLQKTFLFYFINKVPYKLYDSKNKIQIYLSKNLLSKYLIKLMIY